MRAAADGLLAGYWRIVVLAIGFTDASLFIWGDQPHIAAKVVRRALTQAHVVRYMRIATGRRKWHQVPWVKTLMDCRLPDASEKAAFCESLLL